MSDSSVGSLLGEAGGCPVVEWNGRKWKIAHPVQKAKAQLEKVLAARHLAAVAELKDALPPASYEAAWAEAVRLVGTGHFRTFRRGWQQEMTGGASSLLLLLGLLRCHQDDATEADAAGLLAERPEETVAALVQVFPALFASLAGDLPLPPAKRTQAAAEMAERAAAVLRGLSASPSRTSTPS